MSTEATNAEHPNLVGFLGSLLNELKAEKSTGVKVSYLQTIIERCGESPAVQRKLLEAGEEDRRQQSTLFSIVEESLTDIAGAFRILLGSQPWPDLSSLNKDRLTATAAGLEGVAREQIDVCLSKVDALQGMESTESARVDLLMDVLRTQGVVFETAIFKGWVYGNMEKAWLFECMLWMLVQVGLVASSNFFGWEVKIGGMSVPGTGAGGAARVERLEPMELPKAGVIEGDVSGWAAKSRGAAGVRASKAKAAAMVWVGKLKGGSKKGRLPR